MPSLVLAAVCLFCPWGPRRQRAISRDAGTADHRTPWRLGRHLILGGQRGAVPPGPGTPEFLLNHGARTDCDIFVFKVSGSLSVKCFSRP